MEAAAFVLLQLHETNKHTIKHKETSKRLWLEQNLVFVQTAEKKKKKKKKKGGGFSF